MASLLKFFGFDTGPIKAVESLSLSLSWGWAGMVLLLLLLVPIILYFYRFEERQISVSDKRTFLGLRLLFVVLFALLLAGPIIVVSGNIPQKNRLAVLIDSSRSMSIKADDETRLEKVKKAFSERKLLARLQNQTDR
jgi:phosphoglycerol transferase MdoB-like AlkP superfamily enzyme